jgi:glycosyltransferase involved in cell wall biosynthesis
MIKLVVQIPCYNGAETLPTTLAALPRQVEGVDVVEWLIIDDGSVDDTVEVARRSGVNHVVRHQQNRGLASAFMTGLDACLRVGATIIVNTDADNQYSADSIPDLIRPILEGRAEIVVGDREVNTVLHFSPTKRLLQRLGSYAVRMASGTEVADAPSGFRAIHRRAARQLNVFGQYTYTLETIIQAGQKNMAIASVPVKTNGPTRPSRLIKSIPEYINRSIWTIIRIFMVYKPLKTFFMIAAILVIPGMALGFRYLYFFAIGEGQGMLQSLILSAILIVSGFVFVVAGLISDLIAINRKILEEVRTRLIRLEYRESYAREYEEEITSVYDLSSKSADPR